MSVVVKAAVVPEHEPPLPPALEQTGLGALVQITSTGGPWGVRDPANVRADGQSQQIGAFGETKKCQRKEP